MGIISGLCLGQPHEPSAFAILERSGSGNDATYQLKALERYKAGDPYPDTFDRIAKWYKKPEIRGTTLVVDKTDVGRGIVDLLQRRQIGACLQTVQVTHGHHVGESEGGFSVPKVDAIASLQSVISTKRLKLPMALLPGTLKTLKKELESFRMKNPATLGGDPMEPHRDSEGQSDLIYAVCCPIWYSDRHWGPTWIPSNNPSQRSPMWQMLYGDGSDSEARRRLADEGLRPA